MVGLLSGRRGVGVVARSGSFLSPDLYPRGEIPLEGNSNWRAKAVLTRRRQVRGPEPHADAVCFEGNSQAYVQDLRKRKGPDADQPHQIAYKKLVRA